MNDAHALQASLGAAPRSAFAALPDDAAQPTGKERRDRRRVRRRAMLDLSRQIFDLHDRGATNDEIAKVVDRSPRAVRALAASRGVLISRTCTIARYAITVTLPRRETLRKLAFEYGASPAETLEDLVTFALSDHALIARRTLRVGR
jgi:hypothetical protein